VKSGTEEAFDTFAHGGNQIGIDEGGILAVLPVNEIKVALQFGEDGPGQFVAIDERPAVRTPEAGECLFIFRADAVVRHGMDALMQGHSLHSAIALKVNVDFN
jgi:hypothetical protein